MRLGQATTLCVALGLLPGAALGDMTLSDVVSPKGLKGFVRVSRLPVPTSEPLAQGRKIWGKTCFKCHGGNKAIGAPKITSTDAWAPRIDKGVDVLFANVLTGFTGPTYSIMPPRGGTTLDDDELALALAFMVWASGGADAAQDFISARSPKTNEEDNDT